VLFRLLWVATKGKRIVPIAHCGKFAISLPTISANDGARRNVVIYECCERADVASRKRNIRLFGARDNAEPEASSISEFLGWNTAFVAVLPFHTAILGVFPRPNFNGPYYCCLMMNSTPFAMRAPANATFIYFDRMRSFRLYRGLGEPCRRGAYEA